MSRLTRRQFAASLGAALCAAPFLDLLARRGNVAHAAPQRPERLLVFFTPNGTVHRHLWPSGGESDFQFPAGSILEPLAPHRQDLLILDGIDFIGVNNHEGGMANMLTGGGGVSVDQHIAGSIGKDSRFSSLELGVQTSAWGGNVQTRMCYAGPGQPVTPEDNPKNAFVRLFGAAMAGDADRLLRRKKSVLDQVRGELTDLKGQLGKGEQVKLDQHLAALRQVEQSMSAAPLCERPAAPMARDPYPHANFPAIGKDQMDLAVLALRCGLTKVVSLQWAHTVTPTVFSWLNLGEAHHELSHKGDGDAEGVARFVRCERWFAEQFAYLIQRLKDAPDPKNPMGGSLLDSTLVLWAKELGDGRLHTCASVPFVLAGGSGYFRSGRYLKYKGAPHQQLLVSVCQALGLTNNSFGDAARGSGPLPGLR